MEALMFTALAAANLQSRFDGLIASGASIMWAALGLGLVIFFHELGHFAVAKWCNVNVERFSIGFGPILFSKKWGETEYALSIIPFGGYVKMLGQDDADPSQLTNEEIAQDPRSYLAKNVWQRMAIISAGVTMNVITAVMFVGAAFYLGVELPPSIIGDARPGMPAWVAGLKPDDRITKINDRIIQTFDDVRLNAAVLSPPLRIEGVHRDGTTFTKEVRPETENSTPRIGISNAMSLKVLTDPKGKIPFAFPGTAATRATPPLERGDIVSAVNGVAVGSYAEMTRQIAVHKESDLKLEVHPNGDLSKSKLVSIPDNFFRTLGLMMDTGPVAAVQSESPADKAGLLKGDKLSAINGRLIGTDIDPLKLPNEFAALHGQEVKVTVTRQNSGGGQGKEELTIVPDDIPGWIEQPSFEGEPLSIPSIGVAFHTIPVVLAVVPNSPAAKAGVVPGPLTKVKKVILSLPKDSAVDEVDGDKRREVTINLDDEKNENLAEFKAKNWNYAFWSMQMLPQRAVKLTIVEGKESRDLELMPVLDTSWPMPVVQGLRMHPAEITLKAENVADVWSRATNYTRNSAISIYLTLKGLVTGQVKLGNLSGPIGIASAAVQIVKTSVPQFLMFLAFLSVNLAVLNFLPIPVLDGGHMVFLIWEAITRKRPSERVVIGASYLGMAFLLSLMVFVLVLDISRLFKP